MTMLQQTSASFDLSTLDAGPRTGKERIKERQTLKIFFFLLLVRSEERLFSLENTWATAQQNDQPKRPTLEKEREIQT